MLCFNNAECIFIAPFMMIIILINSIYMAHFYCEELDAHTNAIAWFQQCWMHIYCAFHQNSCIKWCAIQTWSQSSLKSLHTKWETGIVMATFPCMHLPILMKFPIFTMGKQQIIEETVKIYGIPWPWPFWSKQLWQAQAILLVPHCKFITNLINFAAFLHWRG